MLHCWHFFVNIGDEVPIDTPLLLLGEPGEELDLEEDLASLVKGTKNSSHARLEKEQKVLSFPKWFCLWTLFNSIH